MKAENSSTAHRIYTFFEVCWLELDLKYGFRPPPDVPEALGIDCPGPADACPHPSFDL